ncbi:MAG: glycosyltransferase [Sulfitobacter sp.]
MRIGVFAERFPKLSETFITAQVSYFARQGHDVTVVCKYHDAVRLDPATVSDLAKVKVLTYCGAPETGLLSYLPWRVRQRIGVWRTRRFFQRLPKMDVHLAHFGWMGAFVVANSKNEPTAPPLVTIYHGRDVSHERVENGLSIYHDLFRHGALHLTVNAPFADDLIAAGAPKNRVTVHHLGIPVHHHAFEPALPKTPLRLVTVCRLVEKKGVATILSALADLSKRRPDIEWAMDIGGDGPLRGSLEAQADATLAKGMVRFLGPQNHAEALQLMAQADAFLLPSVTAADGDQEGIPVVLFEAMALGTPVFTTRHSGIPELVEHEVTGFLSDEHDAADLSRQIEALADGTVDLPAITQAARKKVERDFNEDRQNTALLEMLGGLVT